MNIAVELNVLPAKNALIVLAKGFGLAGYGSTKDIALKSLLQAIRVWCNAVDSNAQLGEELQRRGVQYERGDSSEIRIRYRFETEVKEK